MSDYDSEMGAEAIDYYESQKEVRESFLIERHWDRIMSLGSENLLLYPNRAKWKCAVLNFEAFLTDLIEGKLDYKDKIKNIKTGSEGTPKEEIDKTLALIKELKMVLAHSGFAQPGVMMVVDDE